MIATTTATARNRSLLKFHPLRTESFPWSSHPLPPTPLHLNFSSLHLPPSDKTYGHLSLLVVLPIGIWASRGHASCLNCSFPYPSCLEQCLKLKKKKLLNELKQVFKVNIANLREVVSTVWFCLKNITLVKQMQQFELNFCFTG